MGDGCAETGRRGDPGLRRPGIRTEAGPVGGLCYGSSGSSCLVVFGPKGDLTQDEQAGAQSGAGQAQQPSGAQGRN